MRLSQQLIFEVIILKIISKGIIISATLLLFSGCSFEEIKSDKNIVTSDSAETTTTMQVLEVPELTTTTTAATTPAEVIPGEDVTSVVEENNPFPALMITTANVNARKGPSTADEISQTVVEGTEVTVVGYADGWYQIDLDGETLYIIEDYLEAVVENSDESDEEEQQE